MIEILSLIGDKLSVKNSKNLQNILSEIERVFGVLSIKSERKDREDLASFIVSRMSNPARIYHNVTHILSVSKGLDPLGVLAALYHDIVYFALDNGLPLDLLNHHGQIQESSWFPAPSEENILGNIALDVFGFLPSQPIPMNRGGNELLSALTAMELLKKFLTSEQMIAIFCAIYATIPFQGKKFPLDNLEKNLQKICEKYPNAMMGIPFKQESLRRAALLAIKDVDNFYYKNIHRFLKNTWKLLLENNPKIRQNSLFTLSDYVLALKPMESFIRSIQPEDIFYQYQNTPTHSELEFCKQQCSKNLDQASLYLQIKLYGAILAYAVGIISGGDGPFLSFFEDHTSFKMEKNSLGSLFKNEEKLFDKNIFPLCNQIIQVLKNKKFNLIQNLSTGKDFWNGKISPEAFLRQQPEPLIVYLVETFTVSQPKRHTLLRSFIYDGR
jgi:hypothetical protein